MINLCRKLYEKKLRKRKEENQGIQNLLGKVGMEKMRVSKIIFFLFWQYTPFWNIQENLYISSKSFFQFYADFFIISFKLFNQDFLMMTMSSDNHLNDIFQSQQDSQKEPVSSFLDISEFIFTDQYFNIEKSSPEHEKCSIEHPLFFQTEEPKKSEKGSQEGKGNKIVNKCMGKSVHNKNVCFNICQKTVKVIKKNLYEERLKEICARVGLKIDDFKDKILRVKKNLTGFKALSQYLDTKSREVEVFREFMKWFLREKYLRHALNEGQMKDVKIYIQYKNQVILPLLS